MISKELLSAVLNVNCTKCESAVYGGMLGFKTDNRYFNHLINVYELAHKCKEWAWSKSYVSNSIIFVDFESNKVYSCAIAIANELNWKKFEADTEPEAIFKACEWVLKEHPCNQLT